MTSTDAALARANIDNLTALWRAMGATPVSERQPDLGLKSLEWPRRCWFSMREAMAEPAELDRILAGLPTGYIVPVWEGPQAPCFRAALEMAGYQLAFQQLAMTLSLHAHSAAEGNHGALQGGQQLTLHKLESTADIRSWCELGGAAFGYLIDDSAISRAISAPGLECYLACIDGEAVATALLYRTGEIAGIHQVGVPRAFRGRGIARSLMHLLIARSRERGANRVTLQASAEGEALYRAMNFDPQFRISNYARDIKASDD